MQRFSKEHESSFVENNNMPKKSDLLMEIYREVGEIHTKVDGLVGLKDDVESLKATRNKVYGLVGVGLLATFMTNLESFFEAVKRSFH